MFGCQYLLKFMKTEGKGLPLTKNDRKLDWESLFQCYLVSIHI